VSLLRPPYTLYAEMPATPVTFNSSRGFPMLVGVCRTRRPFTHYYLAITSRTVVTALR
jgi:hypothetical protein